MIKNRNIKMGLLVFLITLIGLVTLVELNPRNQSVQTDEKTQDKLEIVKK